MKKIIFGVIFVAILLRVNHLIKQASFKRFQSTKTPVTPALIPVIEHEVNAGEIKPDVPVKLVIPAIGLEAKIIPVGLTPERIVDVPVSDVGWYQNGVKPGEIGNAALNGHFKGIDFSPGIFNGLSGLKSGDEITIIDALGHNFQFKVREIQLVDTETFPIQKVYGSIDKAQINLVTCAGYYDKDKRTYSQRTIIFAELVR